MGKYQFILSSGPENPTRATRAVMFAAKAVEEGHEVVLFLVDDAVYLANPTLREHVKAPTGDDLMRYLSVLLDHATPVLVCLPCAATRGVEEASLPEGWRLGRGVEAIQADAAGFTTWVF